MGNHFSPAYLSKIGKRGGKATARNQGKKFFAKISKKRKHFRGGRPRKLVPVPTAKKSSKRLTKKQAKAILESLD